MYESRKYSCAERISEALYIRKMKQVELCEKTGIPKSAMSQYVSGLFEPKHDRIYKIALALDVSEAWLMGYDVPMERTSGKKESPTDIALKEWLAAASEEEKQALLLLLRNFNNK